HRPTTIDVRGSARRRITSDLARWSASVSVVKPTRVEAYAALKKDVAQLSSFLESNGVPPSQYRASAVTVTEVSHEETKEEGTRVLKRTVFDGYRADQSIELSSADVPRVERLSREATQLLENGIDVTSSPPSYLFTKVQGLKIDMLGEASKDARERAERMLDNAGGGAKVGQVVGIDTGVININAANSTETSWEGNYDTTSYEKDIITSKRTRTVVMMSFSYDVVS